LAQGSFEIFSSFSSIQTFFLIILLTSSLRLFNEDPGSAFFFVLSF